TVGPAAFELGSGRERELATLAEEGAPGTGDRVRLDYLSSPVGRGFAAALVRSVGARAAANTRAARRDLRGRGGAVWLVCRLPGRVSVRTRPGRRSALALADAGGCCLPLGRPGPGLLPTLPVSAARERPLGA